MKLFSRKLLSYDITGPLTAKRAVHGLVTQLIMNLKGLIIVPFLAYLLKTDGMGQYALATSAASLLIPVISLNLRNGSVAFITDLSHATTVAERFYACMLTSLAGGVAGGCVLYALAAAGIGPFTPVLAGVIALFMVAYIWYDFALELPQAYQHTGIVSLIRIAVAYAAAVAGILLVAAGWQVPGMIVAEALVMLLAGVVLLEAVRREIGITLRIDGVFLRQCIGFSLPLIVTTAFMWIMQSADNFMIHHYKGVSSVGVYALAYSLSSPLFALMMALNYFWYPTALRLSTENTVKFVTAVHYTARYLTVIIAGIFLLYIINGEVVVRLIAGAPFLGAVPVLPLILLSFGCAIIARVFETLLYMKKHARTIALVYGASAALNLGLNMLLIPSHGIMGAGVATLIAYAAAAGSMCVCALRRFSITLPVNVYAAFFSGICAAVPAYYGAQFTGGRIFSSAGISALVLLIYAGLLAVSRAITTADILFLRSLFKNNVFSRKHPAEITE